MSLRNKFLSSPPLDWSKISSLSPSHLVPLDSLPIPSEPLDNLLAVKLNGGIGTSMSCSFPKSLIKVKGDETFLDLVIQEMKVPLVLMNSDFTDEETKKKCNIPCFKQTMGKRLDAETLEELNSWYPEGHGSFYKDFVESGIGGKEFIFLSNIDNLGAKPDFRILKYMMDNNLDFVMEVTCKTKADIKGGILVSDGEKVRLIEIAQVPKEKMEFFESFPYFNTNNLWIRKSKIRADFDLDLIVNRKVLDGKNVIQLETACGAAISHFEKVGIVVVGRDRFKPVKNCSDLFLAKFFHGESPPEITFGEPFTNLEEFEKRIPFPPNISQLEKLHLQGNITFGKNVTLKGIVLLDGRRRSIHIQDESFFEDESII